MFTLHSIVNEMFVVRKSRKIVHTFASSVNKRFLSIVYVCITLIIKYIMHMKK